MPSLKSLLKLTFILSALVFLAAPDFAEARAGGGRSMGSRGSRTYQSPTRNAAPLERSAAPKPQPGNPNSSLNNNSSAPQPAAPQSSGFGSFGRGFAGGLLGAGIGSLLFGHSGFAGMGGGMGGGGMGILPILLLIGGGYFLYRMFFRSNTATSTSSFVSPFASNNAPSSGSFASNVSTISGEPIAITETDKQAFSDLLLKVQSAWSEGDLTHMRLYATPEMVHYFSQELSKNASQGLVNKVEHVKLENAQMIESFRDDELEYATAHLTWSACDYMTKIGRTPEDSDYIVSGDSAQAETVEEIWTFMRSRDGRWLLSAIQQVQ